MQVYIVFQPDRPAQECSGRNQYRAPAVAMALVNGHLDSFGVFGFSIAFLVR